MSPEPWGPLEPMDPDSDAEDFMCAKPGASTKKNAMPGKKKAVSTVKPNKDTDPLLANEDLLRLCNGILPLQYMRPRPKSEQRAGIKCTVLDGCDIYTQHWHCNEHPAYVPQKTADAEKHTRLHFRGKAKAKKAAEKVILKGRTAAAPRGPSSSRGASSSRGTSSARGASSARGDSQSRDLGPAMPLPKPQGEAYFTAVLSPVDETSPSAALPSPSSVCEGDGGCSMWLRACAGAEDAHAYHMLTLRNNELLPLEVIMLNMAYIPATDFVVNRINDADVVDDGIVSISKENDPNFHEKLLKLMFKNSVDHHALHRISAAIGLGASASFDFNLDAVRHWEGSKSADADTMPPWDKALFGKTVDTCCKLLQMSRVAGAMVPNTDGNLDGSLGSTTCDSGVGMQCLLDIMLPTAHIGILAPGGVEWSPPGYRPLGFKTRDLCGIDVSGPFQVQIRSYKKLDSSVAGPKIKEFSSDLIGSMPADALLCALPHKMVIDCDISQHQALNFDSEAGKANAIKMVKNAQPESNAGCLTSPVLLQHGDRFYTVTAFQFMLTHFRQNMVVSEVTTALQASWSVHALGRAQHLNVGAQATDSFLMVDFVHGLMKMLPHEQGVIELLQTYWQTLQPKIAAYDKLLNAWDGDCVTYDMSFYGVQHVSVLANPELFERKKPTAACEVCGDPLISPDMATLLNVLEPDADEQHQEHALEHRMCNAKCGKGIHLSCIGKPPYHHSTAHVPCGDGTWHCNECIQLVMGIGRDCEGTLEHAQPCTRSQTAVSQASSHIRAAPLEDQILLHRAQKIAIEFDLPEFQALDFATVEGRDAAVQLMRTRADDNGTTTTSMSGAANATNENCSTNEKTKEKLRRCKVASGYFDVCGRDGTVLRRPVRCASESQAVVRSIMTSLAHERRQIFEENLWGLHNAVWSRICVDNTYRDAGFLKTLVMELFPEAVTFYGNSLFETRCLIVQDLYHAIMRLVGQFSQKNPDYPAASVDARRILNRSRATRHSQEEGGRDFNLSKFWDDPVEAAHRVGIADFATTGKLSQLNVDDVEVTAELLEVYNARNEENLLWGSPPFALPPSALQDLCDAFGLVVCPIETLGWKLGQVEQRPAFASSSVFDAALLGLQYRYSVQHSSQSTDMSMAGDIMRRSFAHTVKLSDAERAEWLRLAHDYKNKGVDPAFMKVDLETPEGQEQGIATAIVAEARYDLLAWELNEPLSRHGVCTGPVVKAIQNLLHPGTKPYILNNGAARSPGDDTKPGAQGEMVYGCWVVQTP